MAASSPAPYHMSAVEKELVRRMHFQQKQRPTDIAKATGRNLSSIVRALQTTGPPKKPGPKPLLTVKQIDRLEALLETMVEKADAKYEVTAKMLKIRSRSKASERVIMDALHARGVFFRPLREKVRLTEDDIKDRFAFAKKYRGKSAQWWVKTLHAAIDLKTFQVYLNGKARAAANRREVRGTYRKRGQGLDRPHVKSQRRALPGGAASAKIAAGVGGGKVILWDEQKKGWGGDAAARLYTGPLLQSLKRAFPGRKTFTVLEDNDPAGFRSSKGLAAKDEAGIKIFRIPAHSPDLNVCDYALWAKVNRDMRAQEETWPKGKRESRDEYLARLQRTAKRLPSEFINKAIGNMKERCARLYEAQGCLFEEGGAHSFDS